MWWRRPEDEEGSSFPEAAAEAAEAKSECVIESNEFATFRDVDAETEAGTLTASTNPPRTTRIATTKNSIVSAVAEAVAGFLFFFTPIVSYVRRMCPFVK